MANKLQIKRTTVAGRAPNTTNSANTTFIDTGELALNLADGKLFTSDGTDLIEFGTGTPVYDASGNLITTTYVQITTLSNAASHVIPTTTNTYDIGTTSLKWRDVYISNNVSVGNTTVNVTVAPTGLTLTNNNRIRIKTLNGNTVSLVQQEDDNFVFYTTNTSGGERPVYNIYANSDTSSLSILVPMALGQPLSANGATGTAGQVLTSNGATGSPYWSTASGGGMTTGKAIAMAMVFGG